MVSLDGYYEGPGGMMDVPFDDAFGAYNLERLKTASTVLLGHNSYRMFGGFWPDVENNSRASEVDREFSRLYNKTEKVVVSDNPVEPALAWQNTTRVISRDVYNAITKLKHEPGKDIVMWGSRTLWNDLLAHRLVDELHFVVGNAVLGDGTPAFAEPIPVGAENLKLKLLDLRRTSPTSESFIAKYAVKYINK